MPPAATGLDHVAIAADDTVALTRWYEKTLGLVVVFELPAKAPASQPTFLIGPPAAGGLRGGMMLEIMPRNQCPRHPRQSHDAGISHIALRVSDFDAMHERLKACGVTFLGKEIQGVGGGRLISFADSEANMIQIIDRADREKP